MKKTAFFRVAVVVTLAAFVFSCATTHVPPISGAGAAFKPDKDEKALWQASRDEEQKLLSKAKLHDDPLLEDYLEGIVRRLNPPAMAENPEIGFRVRVIEDPTLNAFAYPHGTLYVHTGLLARMENEDQLATVLGHEMTHVEGRHMLRYQRSAQNKAIAFSVAAIAAAVIVAGKEGDAVRDGDYGRAARTRVLTDILVGLGLQLAFIAAINGYGRNLEREADEGGFQKMAAAGYDTNESPRVYQLLMEDHGDQGKTEAFFFGSHPRLAERITAAKEWNAAHKGSAPVKATGADNESFARRMRPVVREDARLNIDLGRLSIAEYELNRVLKLTPDDPAALLLMGRLRLKQADGEKRDDARRARLDEAEREFEATLKLNPEQAAAHRELGVLAFKRGDNAGACRHFDEYLRLAPRAEDAARIRDYQLELKKDGRCPEAAPAVPAAPPAPPSSLSVDHP